MNISYNWLKDLIDIDLSPDDLGKKLTNVGLAVEGIHNHGNDHVFDIDLTSNRPDCLSHFGVAREISVITQAKTRHVGSVPLDHGQSASSQNLVTIEDPDLCHRFTARIIRGVKIGPSPQWLVDRLEAIGERPINNVADITNYVMHELGQPMHSFDLDKLSGQRIVVRRAKVGEIIKTLDEVERELDDSMLAICDAEKPAAVAGIMGGLNSSITRDTTNVLLEVALFKRSNIRATSRTLNLSTEASYRFERGVDIDNLERASYRAAQLMAELAGGQIGEFVDVYPTPFEPQTVKSNDISSAVKRLTGLETETLECLRILDSLGITEDEGSSRESRVFSVPSWRHDIAIEEDLVEEIARHAGYENISAELPPAYGAGEYQPTESREKRLRQTLVDIGFDEALSYSFIDTKFDELFEIIPGLLDADPGERFITLQDSVIDGAVRMRPSIIPGLLDAVRLNFNHQRKDLRLFELGKVFASKTGEDNLPNEQKSFALIVTGSEVFEGRAMPVRQFDFYDAKGAVEAALESTGVQDIVYKPADVKHLRRGQSASFSLNGTLVGYVGRLDDDIAASYKFRQPVYLAELNFSTITQSQVQNVAYRPLVKFPAIVRDISFVVDRKTEFSNIRRAISEQGFLLCRNVMFVDIYEGKGLAEDERSITVRLEYRSDEGTLIDDEVEVLHKQIVSQTEQKLGIRTRF